ncbi:protein lifeguard 3-like [Macrosteles quadrilineatus]|uniref:protein lifeguard 3-like n=1 Tax=Macrosteles quadrilineatus TaxID=74068 RepID=UPI0023E1949C|nr:protein lifeguard 3-like [Macrosteles quadrilineatus]XP_054288474.1 protein lifeguard 3-like [Macrosteles quadrilineatus]XP_054288475.1 protein lifeguard 3-like [Macrosteles quadrilineatus]
MMEAKTEDIENGYENNGEEVVFKNLDFTEKSIRRGFIRKVYGILMVQLMISLGFVSIFMYVEPVKQFVHENGAPFVLAGAIIAIVTIIILLCSTNARRRAPANIIFLGVFTLSFSFLLGVVCAASQKEEVYWALGICTIVTISLTIFAWQTKIDFTMCHGTMFVLLMILVTVGIGSLFVPYDRTTQLIIAGFGAFVYSLLLIHDTQLIVGGKHKLVISPEEYVFAALSLYLDIISLFLRILRIMRLA